MRSPVRSRPRTSTRSGCAWAMRLTGSVPGPMRMGADPLTELTAGSPCVTLNQVVQYQHLDQALSALADPTRRSILERLGRGEATISELAAPAGISLTGIKKHVQVLEDAGLVRTEKVGRVRYCRLEPGGLDAVEAWIQDYRRTLNDRLDRFGELLERTKGEAGHAQ